MEETESDKLSSSPINPCSSKNVGIFKVIFKKKQYEISFDLDSTISQLKDHLHAIIGKEIITSVTSIMYRYSWFDSEIIPPHRCSKGNAESYGQRACP